jgi:hypothetical protein
MNVQAIPQDEPLIWTIRGNVPMSSLHPADMQWVINDDFIKVVERYRAIDTGEVVKESAHVYDRKGTFAAGLAASMG